MTATGKTSLTGRNRKTAAKPAKARTRQAAATRGPRASTAGRRRVSGLGASAVMAFVATADGPRARDFYRSVLGLRLVADDPFAVVMDANGIMLRIQKVEKVTRASYTTLGWNVDDIAATVRRLVKKGVVLERYPGLEQDDLGIWTSPSGARVAWFRDPDGNLLSLTQF